MDPTVDISAIDMNNPSNLACYSKIILFQSDYSRDEVHFNSPDASMQRTIQTLAHSLGLVYEYSRTSGKVTISRPILPGLSEPHGSISGILNLGHAADHLDNIEVPARGDTFTEGLFSFDTDDISEERFDFDLDKFLAAPDLGAKSHNNVDALVSPANVAESSGHILPEQCLDPSMKCNIITESRRGYEESQCQQIASSQSSMNSIGSQARGSRPRMPSGRKPLTKSAATQGFQEYVFDSRSTRSASRTSDVSVSSGRRGPLDQGVLEAMKALKSAGGACWRCKFQRKTCNPDIPCLVCLNGSQHLSWQSVGCKRGLLKSSMPAMVFCPRSPSLAARYGDQRGCQSDTNVQTWANDITKEASQRRAEEIRKFDDLVAGESSQDDTFYHVLDKMGYPGLQKCYSTTFSIAHASRASLIPLDQCIVGIIWEVCYSSPPEKLVDGLFHGRTVADIAILLHSAARYQANLETDQLIAQSLICLRDCLDALPLKISGYLEVATHRTCQLSLCGINCISDLESDLARFTDELSRVFSLKETLRNKNWWLSVFYSLCIQALVRRILIQLDRPKAYPSASAVFSEKHEYMHLAVRLFIASSGKHDPLIESSASAPGLSSMEEAQTANSLNEIYCEARMAVQQSEWPVRGISTSGDYLKMLFEIEEKLPESVQKSPPDNGRENFQSGDGNFGMSVQVLEREKDDSEVSLPTAIGNKEKTWLVPRGAATSLFVEPIARMCNSLLKRLKIKKTRFPLREETKRGILRVFGRGEGLDQPPGYDADSEKSDKGYGSDRCSVSSWGSGEWGQVGSTTEEHSQGEMAPKQMPDLSRRVVCDLVESYKVNINIVYPILSHRRLDMLVEAFLRAIPEDTGEKTIGVAIGAKRKRSPVATPERESFHPGRPFRSISTALVFLVLALGEICLSKGRVPGPLSDEPPRRSEKYSPFLRNVDFIPGLSYFSLATDIIGNHIGGNSLTHVHANILASLYHSQLPRALESHAFIYQASRTLQFLIRPSANNPNSEMEVAGLTSNSKLERYRKIKAERKLLPAKDNAFVFAFWICIQIESDILAELPCPHSGLLNYEGAMPIPNLQAAHEIDGVGALVLESYGAQLHLRKLLHMVQNMLTKPSQDSSWTELGYFRTLAAAEADLSYLRTRIVPNMTWNDSDPPANNILDALLRAQYHYTLATLYRPFLWQILDISADRLSSERQGASIMCEFRTGIKTPSISKSASGIEDIDSEVHQYLRKGIKSLIGGLEAFSGLGNPGTRRLIVPNVWGIAHRQWGDILLLIAAHEDPILRHFIDTDLLKDILAKTMSFLKLLAHDPSGLHFDWKILEYVGEVTGLAPVKRIVEARSGFHVTSPLTSPDLGSLA